MCAAAFRDPEIVFLRKRKPCYLSFVARRHAALPLGQGARFRGDVGARNLQQRENSLFAPASL
jgi:hypothetical protein